MANHTTSAARRTRRSTRRPIALAAAAAVLAVISSVAFAQGSAPGGAQGARRLPVANPPATKGTDNNTRDQLNRAKAALHGGRYADAKAGFERLAQAGNADAQFYLGRMAAAGLGVPKDPAAATALFRRAAEQGHAESQARLGSQYFLGTGGLAKSYPEAARWSRLAAEQGHGGAAYNLAKLYHSGGDGLAADPAEAQKWGKVAMAKGFPDPFKDAPPSPKHTDEAMAVFAEGHKLYKSGNMAGAAQAFRRCADMGDAACQLQIGWHYDVGKGVPRNDAEAVRWYRAAAEQNHRVAQYNLGNMLQLGRGVAKNCRNAVEWYARSSLHNYPRGLYGLGRMYQFGFGVKEDRPKAHALYRQAAALGDHQAREALATFNSFVWPDQRSRDLYLSRVESYFGTLNGCQAQADLTRTSVTCLVPVIDWNPKTWQDC
jgi:TPR repeat protein